MILKKEIDCTVVSPARSEDNTTEDDKGEEEEEQGQQSVVEAYKQLWKICTLRSVLSLLGVLLTMKVC